MSIYIWISGQSPHTHVLLVKSKGDVTKARKLAREQKPGFIDEATLSQTPRNQQEVVVPT